MNTKFKIINHGSTAWKNAVKLREDILRKPLGSVFTQEELEEEKNHIQVVGVVNGEIISTAVLVPEGEKIKMQRVVVNQNLQNNNVGSEMMSYCEEFSVNQGFEMLYCHARDSAVNFYLKNGYIGEGEYFDEDGIPHLKMYKSLV